MQMELIRTHSKESLRVEPTRTTKVNKTSLKMCPSQKISLTGTAKEINLNVSKGTVCVQVGSNF